MNEFKRRLAEFSGEEQDYLDCCFRLVAFLGASELLDTISDTLLGSPDIVLAKNKQVYYMVCSAVKGKVIRVLRSVPDGDGKQTLKKLDERYSAARDARKLELTKLVITSKCSASKDALDHIDKLSGLRYQLSQLVEIVSPTLAIASLLDTLPEEFHPVVTLPKMQEKPSIEKFKGMVSVHCDNVRSAPTQTVAFNVQANGRSC